MSSYRLWIFAVVMCVIGIVLPHAAAAQSVRVRTGDHPTFTRLVIDFPETPDWKLGRNAGRYELRLDATNVVFDLRDAFRRITDDRIADLQDLGGGRLALSVGCECRLDVRTLPNGGLMIDVRDGGAPATDRWEQSLDANPRPAYRPGASPRPVTLPVVLPSRPAEPTMGPLVSIASDAVPDPGFQRAADVQTDLVEQTARAASQGLITLDASGTDTIRRKLEEDLAKVASKNILTSAPNILIETQIDRDSREGTPERSDAQLVPCIEPARIDVGAWFEYEAARNGLGEARANLVDSRDRLDPLAHGVLARMLIYLSFGLEAKTLLNDGPGDIPDRTLLLELAEIMDGRALATNAILTTQMNCDSPSALWGVLAADQISRSDEINVSAVVRSLSSLPSHLRQFLGPKVALKLMSSGNKEAALQIRNAIERGDAPITPERTMLEATFDIDDGNSKAAEPKLETVATSRSAQAADALAILIENRTSEGRSVEQDLIDQAAALAFEYGDGPKASRLTGAIIEAYVQDLRYADAFALAKKIGAADTKAPNLSAQYRTRILEKLAQHGTDTEFLTFAMREIAQNPVADPARLLIAERFVKLGMQGPARTTLGMRADIPKDRERYILTEIAILEGKPRIAESYLTGLDSDRANELRERVAGMAMRSSPDEKISESVVSTDLPAGEEIEDPAGEIARNRVLLSESREIRKNLLFLLKKEQN
ncbi:hypothetical protein [Oceaniglobus ichthyenteri]|uniref:hypothetical protein n=1 Tax=Oceaniglobus ichthyenteri TaxID=2136177 RepID=UPI000F841DE7|nr:hypothetical protein [Oceaniglobus ichthyenteri]